MITYEDLPENLTSEIDEETLEGIYLKEKDNIPFKEDVIMYNNEEVLTVKGYVKLISKRDERIKELEDKIKSFESNMYFEKKFLCSFDHNADAGYIRIRSSNKKHFPVEVKNGVIVDFDEDGILLGIEILGKNNFPL